jgi:hypothetical protein
VCKPCAARKCRLPTETNSVVRVCLACWNRLSSKKATFSIRARRAGAEQTDLVFLLAEMPACLWAFKSLTTLNLASNDLRAIPAEVFFVSSIL